MSHALSRSILCPWSHLDLNGGILLYFLECLVHLSTPSSTRVQPLACSTEVEMRKNNSLASSSTPTSCRFDLNRCQHRQLPSAPESAIPKEVSMLFTSPALSLTVQPGRCPSLPAVLHFFGIKRLSIHRALLEVRLSINALQRSMTPPY